MKNDPLKTSKKRKRGKFWAKKIPNATITVESSKTLIVFSFFLKKSYILTVYALKISNSPVIFFF